MTSFASLMALSATHTKESQRVVETALQERKRKEAQHKKQQEEKEANEREQQRKLLIKRFEDQKREQERLQRLEVERQAKQLALQRREEEQRDALRYGPKKAAKLAGKHSSTGSGDSPNWPSSSSNREAARKLRAGDVEDDESSGPALTREEIRERKHQAVMRKTFATAKQSTTTGGYTKHGKKLKGGALDIKSPGATAESGAGQTVKARLASIPMTLKVLGGKNKDRRSELEMFYDSKKKRSGQVLEGEEARNFSYFGPSKKEREKMKQAQAASASATTSGADSPGPRPAERSSSSAPTCLKEASSSKPSPVPTTASKKLSVHPRSTSKQASSSISSSKATIPKINKVNPTTQRSTAIAHSRPKRPRSPSLSESPPPKKQHMESEISSTIWKLFGKDRQQYTSRDVFSDDEDMEADATILEREEAYSARIAKKEEILAAQEEERHEEEKRRRKKERERAAARGY